MKISVFAIAFGIILLFSAKSYAQDPVTAKSILAKTDQNSSAIKDKKAHVEMVMVKLKKDKKKVKKAILFQKGADRTLFRYVYPRGDSGIAFLRLPNHQIYIYLSLFKKAKRITNLANSAYNNSDFSFQDMASNSFLAKYFPSLIKTNDTAYILKLIPKIKNDTYQYVTATINRTFYYPEELKYFNQKGEKIKQENFHFIKVKGIWVPREVDMINFDKKHMTKIIMSDIKVNTGLKDEIFTVRNLENKSLNNDLVKK